MIAVIFEVWPSEGRKDEYMDYAARLRSELQGINGFISVERFQSLADPGKLLSLSFWRDDHSVAVWRNREEHRAAQAAGRHGVFQDYRICIAEVVRDYALAERREQAPGDSRQAHDAT